MMSTNNMRNVGLIVSQLEDQTIFKPADQDPIPCMKECEDLIYNSPIKNIYQNNLYFNFTKKYL